MMDMKVSFTPNDLLQMTYAAAAKKINPRIVLTIRIGAGIASVGKDIVVEDIMFQGTLRFKFQLMNPFPHVKTVSFMFLEQPTFDFVPRPIGFDMSIVSGFPRLPPPRRIRELTPFLRHTTDSWIQIVCYGTNSWIIITYGQWDL